MTFYLLLLPSSLCVYIYHLKIPGGGINFEDPLRVNIYLPNRGEATPKEGTSSVRIAGHYVHVKTYVTDYCIEDPIQNGIDICFFFLYILGT